LALALGIKVVGHWGGDGLNPGGAEVDVLFPPQNWPVGLEPKNNDSMVLHVTYGEASVLLEETPKEPSNAGRACLDHPHTPPLKVEHHGSAASTSGNLGRGEAELCPSPRVAFEPLSVSKPDVLARLQDSLSRRLPHRSKRRRHLLPRRPLRHSMARSS